jgi:hypothetical protein
MKLLLTEADRDRYFPGLPLRGVALEGAITMAQAEAAIIAGRELGRQSFVEVWKIPPTRSFYLRAHPVDVSTLKVTSTFFDPEGEEVSKGAVGIDESGLVVVVDPDLVEIQIAYDSEPDPMAIKAALAAVLLYHNAQN